jgi:hypothetical protein
MHDGSIFANLAANSSGVDAITAARKVDAGCDSAARLAATSVSSARESVILGNSLRHESETLSEA